MKSLIVENENKIKRKQNRLKNIKANTKILLILWKGNFIFIQKLWGDKRIPNQRFLNFEVYNIKYNLFK